MSEQTPQTFNLDEWLSGASRPTRSVQIFQRGDMLAELDELGRKIERAEAADDGQRAVSEKGPLALRYEYAKKLEEFSATSIDVRVHGHDVDETRDIMAERYEKSDVPAINRDLVFDALVFPEMTREQYDLFVDKIGPAQFENIKGAYTAACNAEVKPSADFLPPVSTPDDSE